MDARNHPTDPNGNLLQGEWRVPGTAAPARPAAPAVRRLGPAALHLGARRATFAQERSRAREIISVAKVELANAFDDVRFGRNINVNALWPMVSSITASVERHPAAIMGVSRIRDRHEYTYIHSVAVCGLMIGLARRLGIDPAQHHDLGLAGMLHDVGKARIPTSLLDKPSELTPDEREVVRQHCMFGHDILTASGDKLPEVVIDVCLHHHERLDGTGYPDGRAETNLSVAAKMAAICDVYDALTSKRPYGAPWSPAQALEWMTEQTGHFDPTMLSMFSGMIGIFPVGSMVRLQSDRLAVVLEDPESDPTAPPVCPFFCIQTKQSLPWRRSAPGVDPIIGIELPQRWRLNNWPDIRAAVLARFPPENEMGA